MILMMIWVTVILWMLAFARTTNISIVGLGVVVIVIEELLQYASFSSSKNISKMDRTQRLQ